MTSMFDSVSIDQIPSNADAVAGYTSGFWPTFVPLCQRFPKARHVSIAIAASHDAEVLDCEAGDASPDQAPAWVIRQLHRGVHRPVVYCSVSAVGQVLAALRAAGIQRGQVRLWTAHYTFRPHICSPACGNGMPTTADATQWTDRALGRNLDESLCADSFFAKPPALNINHYERFIDGSFPYGAQGIKTLNERHVVQRHDHLKHHPRLNAHALREIHPQLVFLRKRVWYEAVRQHPQHDGRPSWGDDWRGFRWQHLKARTG